MKQTPAAPRRPIPLLVAIGSRISTTSGWIVVVAILCLLILMGPVLRDPTRQALGSSTSEAPAHLWATWASLQSLFETGPFAFTLPIDHPFPFEQPSTNPVNTLLTAPVWWLSGGGQAGAILAWNALHAASILLTVLGMGTLGRRLLGPDRALPIALGALVAGLGPFLIAQPLTGRAEYFSAALLPWHILLCHRALREGGLGSAVGAGLLLGAIVQGGPYLGPLLLLVEPPMAIGMAVAASREQGRSTASLVCRFGIIALVALFSVAPLAAFLIRHPWPGVDQRLSLSGHDGQSYVEPLGRLIDTFRLPGATGAGFRARPGRDAWSHDGVLSPAFCYPGLVAMLIGLLGLLRPKRGALSWWILALWIVLLSLGPMLSTSAGGVEKRWYLPPAALVAALPLTAVVHNWLRIACFVSVPVGIAAMYGLAAVEDRLRQPGLRLVLGLLALLLVAVDQLTYPTAYAFPRPTFSVDIPEELTTGIDSLPEGALLGLPNTAYPPRTTVRMERVHLLWQLQHGRAVSSNVRPTGDSTLPWSYLSRLDAITRFNRNIVAEPPPESERAACIRADALRLREHGFAGVYLAFDLDPDTSLATSIEAGFGPPAVRGERVLLWDLSRVPPTEEETICSWPWLPMLSPS